jgi:hypothetical protein
MFVTVELLYGTQGRRERKREWQSINNIEIHKAPVAHACNPSYSGGKDKEDQGSKPAWASSSQDPISKIPITKKGWWSGSICRLWVQAPVPPPPTPNISIAPVQAEGTTVGTGSCWMMGVGGKGERRVTEGVEQAKVKYTTVGYFWETLWTLT